MNLYYKTLTMINVFIVDDHLLFRMGIRTVLANSADITVVGEAAGGIEFFEKLNSTSIDIVLLDLILPDMQGIDIATRLKKEYPDIKILVLSSDTTSFSLQQLLKIGIDGFISKENAYAEELIKAIHSVMRGEHFYGKDICTILYNIFISKDKTRLDMPNLTEREMEIIKLCHSGLMSKEIANKLNISSRTVEMHKNNIFKKLGINSTLELVLYAMKNGIITTNN